MTAFVPIQGTNSFAEIPFKRMAGARLWWQNGSPWVTSLKPFGLELLRPDQPFIWSANLSGVFWTPGMRDWKAAGYNLMQYFDLSHVPYQDRNVVCHSHGLQVVLFACAYGLTIRNLISVCSPVRADMMEAAQIARSRIGTWLQISDPTHDDMQRDGEWFDGSWQVVRAHPYADKNAQIAGIDHSNVLYDPAYFHYWPDQGWTEIFKLER